jgi:SOS-response transcriptional repressor LexA
MYKTSDLATRLVEAMGDMTTAEFAGRVGLSQQAISSYRTGARHPKAPTIEIMARELGVSVPWLMGYDSEKKQTASPLVVLNRVPVITNVIANEPFFATQHIVSHIAVPDNWKTDFLFRMGDNSLSTEGITKGDLLCCSFGQAKNGSLAICSIDDEPASVWHVSYHKNAIVLNRGIRPTHTMILEGEECSRVKIHGACSKIIAEL